MLKKEGKAGISKKLACMVLSILTIISFTPLHIFASTNAANDSGNPEEYGTEAYWKAYYGVDTINYFDDEVTAGVTLDGEYIGGCGKKGVYFIEGYHQLHADKSESAIKISGDVTLILMKDAAMIGWGGESDGSLGAGAGIELTEGNSLLVKGLGQINGFGGAGSGGAKGKFDGESGILNEGTQENTMSPGKGGPGGAGGAGGGAGIGTRGGDGAGEVVSQENEYHGTGLFSSFEGFGVDSVDGKDSNPSENAGSLKVAGRVIVEAKGGGINEGETEQSKAGKSCDYENAWDKFCVGGGGGGGNGGNGFAGASIGSGGTSGAGGGTGGSGSFAADYNFFYRPNGGGGGGGAGSGTSKGGGIVKDKGEFTDFPDEGKEGGLTGGDGGEGARTGHEYHGVKGGNGGKLKESGEVANCYSATDVVRGTQTESNLSEGEYAGKEAQIYRAFPIDECKVVFKDPTGDGEDVYKYTEEQIKPSVSLIHIPTGIALDNAAYSVGYGENISPENPDNNYVTITSTGLGDHDVLMDATMSECGEAVTLKALFKVKYEAFINYKLVQDEYEYNGRNVDFGSPTVTDEWDNPIPLEKPLITEVTNSITGQQDEAIDVGEYKLHARLDPSESKYTTTSGGFEHEFKINPEKIYVGATEDTKVEKVYDGTTDVTGYTGDFFVKQGKIYDRDNVEIQFDKTGSKYQSPNYFGPEGKLGIPKVKLVDKNAATSGSSNGSNNYTLFNDVSLVNIPFIIDQREIEVDGGTAKDRAYEEGNKKVEITDISLLDELPSTAKWEKDTDYTISEGTIDSDEPGDHKAQFTVTLPEGGNYIFSNGGSEQGSEADVHITGRPVAPPTPSGTTFKYTGEPQTYDVPGTDDYSVEGNTYLDAGQHTTKYSLTDPNTEWTDPGVGREPYEINWEIQKADSQSVEQSMTVYPDQGLTKHKYQIRPSDLPIGMTRGIEYSVSEASEEYFKSCEVAKMTGLITFELTDKAIEEGQASLVLKIDSDNYEESTFTLTVNVGKLKTATLKGNIHPIDKDYDGQPAHIELTNLVLHDDTTGEEMPLSREQTKVLYVVGDDYVDTVKDAGRYETKIIVDEQLGYAAKLECGDLYTTISPRKVDVDGSGIAVDKVYDGTTDATITGLVTVGNVIEGDTVEAAPIHQDYASPNVQNTPTALGVELSGTDAHNYTAEGLTIPTNYVIEPAKLMLHEGKGIQAQRKYEYENNKITFDINDMDITGFVGAETVADAKAAVEPTTLVESDTASAGEYPSVQYTVTLADDSNYVFDDGTREATGLGDAHVEKAKAQDLGDINITYPVNDYGDKEYQLDLSKLPKGMDEDLALRTVSKIDDNQIIESWSVDNKGLVHFTIAPNKADGDKALLNFEATSKNYADSPFRINIDLKERKQADVAGVKVKSKTYDGKHIEPTGDIVITDENGKDITNQFGDEDITYTYIKLDDRLKASTLNGAPKDAGRYELVVKVDNGFYRGSETVKFTIDKKGICIEGKTLKAVVGQKAPDLDRIDRNYVYEVTGLVNGETLVEEPTMIYEKTPDMSEAGKYVIKLGTAKTTDDYFIEHTSNAKLVVTGDINPDNGKGKAHGVGTGDDSLVFLFSGLGMVSVTTIIFLGMRRRNK